MDILQGYLARFSWILWLVLGVSVIAILVALHRLFSSPGTDQGPPLPLTLDSLPKPLKAKLEEAHERSLVARVSAQTKATEQKQALEQVLQVSEGAERRKRLAELLRSAP